MYISEKRTKIQLSLLIYVSQESIQEDCSTVNTLYKSQNLLKIMDRID